MKYPDKKVLVYDAGTMVSLALRLSEDFGTVFYFTNYKRDYPNSSELQLGEGFDEIKWVKDFWSCIRNEKPDLVVFPQILDGDIQEQLVDMGILVWGSREAEIMEIDRAAFLKRIEQLGLPVPNYKVVKGIDELRKELYKDDKEKFVKIDSNERGNVETFKYIEPEATELSVILPLESKLGSYAKEIQFIITEPIDAVAEIGYDGFVIDGKFPSVALFGIEVKDMGYIGQVRNYDDLPEGVKMVNEKIRPDLKAYGMRGSFSTEIRQTDDGKNYFIDPTMRMPYPPSNLMIEMWDNIAECMYEGARGNLIDPKFRAKFGCEMILYSDNAKEHDYKLIVPDEIRQFVKQPYIFKSKKTGSIIVLPQASINNQVGSVIAYADSMEDCLELCRKRVEMCKGHGLKCDMSCLDEAMEQMEKL